MIVDRQLKASDNQAITGSAVVSTDTIDLTVGRDLSRDVQHMRAFVSAVVGFTGGTSLEVQFIESDNADLSAHTVLATTGAIPVASLTAGAVLMDTKLPMSVARRRYVGFRYVPVGTFTAGQVDAQIVPATDSLKPYLANTGL